jgi:hypothetical protein
MAASALCSREYDDVTYDVTYDDVTYGSERFVLEGIGDPELACDGKVCVPGAAMHVVLPVRRRHVYVRRRHGYSM